MKKLKLITGAVICFILAYYLSGCQKIVYHTVNKPAYLRVFNDLGINITLSNKDAPLPFFTMFIDPAFDTHGVITGGATVGDFLAQRISYAPPYPAHAGNTGTKNVEYPGQENVLVGPILNGIDLSSWAQIPSGKHRIMFVSRPITSVPFLSLDPATRSTKDKILVDTTITLNESSVYTMEVLNPDANSNAAGIYLRTEQFTKIPFSDSSVYVNFYNLSSKGYWQDYLNYVNPSSGAAGAGIKDTMNVYLSLLTETAANGYPNPLVDTAQAGYNGLYIAQMKRYTDNNVTPYYSFPLFAQLHSNHIQTDLYEFFEFYSPGTDPNRDGPTNYNLEPPNYLSLTCIGADYTSGTPNLIITTPSGQNNPQSFGTINTIEIINGLPFLMTVQRKFAPPVIH